MITLFNNFGEYQNRILLKSGVNLNLLPFFQNRHVYTSESPILEPFPCDLSLGFIVWFLSPITYVE